MKAAITEKQVEQFNKMLATLKKISKGYMSPEKLRKNSEKMYGLGFEECIEMVYDNIQADAAYACKNVKPIIIPKPQELTAPEPELK